MNKQIRSLLHYTITFYVLFGTFLSNDCTYLQYHFYFCALIIFHWLTNDNRCFLSVYDHEPNEYTLSILSKIGINIPKENVLLSTIIVYSSVIIPMSITYVKLRKLNCL